MNLFLNICFLFVYSFYLHASTPIKIVSSVSQLHVKISDIKEKLINSESFYTKLAKTARPWPQFTCLNSAFKKGDKDPVISVIRKQLILLKIIKNTFVADKYLFDETLEKGIQTFQKRHSLDNDGIIGRHTCMQLNIPPNVRAKAIQQSLRQFDMLKPIWGTRYIIVNLPTFNLLAINNDLIELTQPVIVGSSNRPTPISIFPIQSIVLNPSWRVPISIFVKDKLSKVLADPEYLKRGDYLIYGSNGELLQSNDIQWEDVSLTYFPYKVRQLPGKKNALGAVKFNLQNDQAIYMHGTPDTALFNKNVRALSSGCIRVQDPISLALWVLNSEKINTEILQEKINSEETIALSIKTPISVFTTNIPVWIDSKGAIQFGIKID